MNVIFVSVIAVSQETKMYRRRKVPAVKTIVQFVVDAGLSFVTNGQVHFDTSERV